MAQGGNFAYPPFTCPTPNSLNLTQPYSPHTKPPAIRNRNFKPRLPITHNCQPPQSASPNTSDIAFWPAFQQQTRLYLSQMFVVFLSLKIQQTVQLESMGNGKIVVSTVNRQRLFFLVSFVMQNASSRAWIWGCTWETYTWNEISQENNKLKPKRQRMHSNFTVKSLWHQVLATISFPVKTCMPRNWGQKQPNNKKIKITYMMWRVDLVTSCVRKDWNSHQNTWHWQKNISFDIFSLQHLTSFGWNAFCGSSSQPLASWRLLEIKPWRICFEIIYWGRWQLRFNLLKFAMWFFKKIGSNMLFEELRQQEHKQNASTWNH